MGGGVGDQIRVQAEAVTVAALAKKAAETRAIAAEARSRRLKQKWLKQQKQRMMQKKAASRK